jgi:hypothetical protein
MQTRLKNEKLIIGNGLAERSNTIKTANMKLRKMRLTGHFVMLVKMTMTLNFIA